MAHSRNYHITMLLVCTKSKPAWDRGAVHILQNDGKSQGPQGHYGWLFGDNLEPGDTEKVQTNKKENGTHC